jgi:hypothetical protein
MSATTQAGDIAPVKQRSLRLSLSRKPLALIVPLCGELPAAWRAAGLCDHWLALAIQTVGRRLLAWSPMHG